jgi:predicted nucleotidyltransferase
MLSIAIESFPENAKRFINGIAKIITASGLQADHYGIFVFGSLVSGSDYAGSGTGTSDVDLLVVVDDQVGRATIERLAKKMKAYERAYFDAHKSRSIVAGILDAIEHQTGMHRNLFIATERDFAGRNFSSMFGTNPVVTKLLAPSNIVMRSALHQMACLHGCKRFTELASRLHDYETQSTDLFTDMLRSIIMNACLSMGAYVLLPLTPRATKYAIEAIKWSIYATTFYITRTRPTKHRQAHFYAKLGISREFLLAWLALSRRYATSPLFVLRSLYNVLKIHATGLRMKARFQAAPDYNNPALKGLEFRAVQGG